jgi:hypothetical protein
MACIRDTWWGQMARVRVGVRNMARARAKARPPGGGRRIAEATRVRVSFRVMARGGRGKGYRQLLLDHVPAAQRPLVATAQGVRQSARPEEVVVLRRVHVVLLLCGEPGNAREPSHTTVPVQTPEHLATAAFPTP